MKKAILLTFILMITPVLATTYLDDCQELNQEGETYILNQSFYWAEDRETCFEITANNIIFNGNGNTLTSFYSNNTREWNIISKAFTTDNLNNITIKNMIIDGFYHGIQLSSSSSTIKNNTIKNLKSTALSLVQSANNALIINNEFRDNGKAGVVISALNVTLSNNQIKNNSHFNVHLVHADGLFMSNNILRGAVKSFQINDPTDEEYIILENNLIDGKRIYYKMNVEDYLFDKQDAGFIGCHSCNNITIKDNSPKRILLLDSTALIENIAMEGDCGGDGIYIRDSQAEMKNSRISNFFKGVHLISSTVILENNIIEKNKVGIYGHSVANLTENIIRKNYDGISLTGNLNYENNIFKHNINQNIFQIGQIYRTHAIGELVEIYLTMPGGDYSMEITSYPHSTIDDIEIDSTYAYFTFSSEKEGLHTVTITMTDNNSGDSETRKILFLIGELNQKNRIIYIHSDSPRYNQKGNGEDYGIIKSSSPDWREFRYCSDFVSFFPEPDYFPYLVESLTMNFQYKSEERAELGFGKFEYITGEWIPSSENYSIANKQFNTYLYNDYAWEDFFTEYTLRFTENPVVMSDKSFQTNIEQEYVYSGVHIKGLNVDDLRDVNILSSVYEDEMKYRGTIELSGIGNATLYLNMEIPMDYYIKYNGMRCKSNPCCVVLRQSKDKIDINVKLSNYGKIEILPLFQLKAECIVKSTASEREFR